MSLIQLTGKHNYVMNTSTPPLLQIITKFLPSQNAGTPTKQHQNRARGNIPISTRMQASRAKALY